MTARRAVVEIVAQLLLLSLDEEEQRDPGAAIERGEANARLLADLDEQTEGDT